MIIAGQLVSPEGVHAGQVRFAGNTIDAVGPALGKADFQFGDECLIFAGMGDIHIHARDDVSQTETYKEDFCSAARAAINGGVVHVADMPNNRVAPIDDATYRGKQHHLQQRNVPIHVTLYAGIGPGTEPLSWAVPYKVYMGHSVGDLFFTTLAQLDATLAGYRGCDVSFHCEDPLLLEAHKHAPTHEERRPAECEVSATRFALQMIEKYDLTGKTLPLLGRRRPAPYPRRAPAGAESHMRSHPASSLFRYRRYHGRESRMDADEPAFANGSRSPGNARRAARRNSGLPGNRPCSAHACRKVSRHLRPASA